MYGIEEIKVGERLRREIGIEWLLTVTGDDDFLRLVERTPGQIWCSLWSDATSSEGVEIYDAVLYFQTRAVSTGREANDYPDPFKRYYFSASNAPRICPEPSELPHLRLQRESEGSEMREAAEKPKGMSPGGIVIGGAVGVLACIALYNWMTKEDED